MTAFVEVLISLPYRFLKQGCKLYVVEMLVFAGAVISVATVATARFREPEMLSAQRLETGTIIMLIGLTQRRPTDPMFR